MPRYAAFLRGVSPMNAKMPEVKRAFEAKAEAAMQKHLGRNIPHDRPLDRRAA
jgi:hypothetical protein